MKFKHFNVSDDASTKTLLTLAVDPASLGLAQFLTNKVFNQAVLGLDFETGGTVTDCHYDTSPANGILDMYLGTYNPEYDQVRADLAARGVDPDSDIPVIHVHHIRWVARITAISSDRKTLTLEAPPLG